MNDLGVKIGCCGWGFFQAKNFFGNDWKTVFKSRLQAYAKLFNVVEVNSTFYKLPKLSTAENWRDQALSVNKNFEFTVKVFRGITHTHKFSSESFELFENVKKIAKALKSKILLFQTPASFKPSKHNVGLLEKFFLNIDRDGFIIVLEVRWHDTWKKQLVYKLFKKLDLEQSIDCLRQDFSFNKKLFYYRLHGFGKPMYNHKFSNQELKKIKTIIVKNKKKGIPSYVFFNNYYMYEDALTFKKMLQS